MFGLDSLPVVTDEISRSISAENPKGEKESGAKAVPDAASAASDLGKGWKVRPCITLPAGSKTTLAEIKGPGVIRHIWILYTSGADCNSKKILHFASRSLP